MLFKNYDINDDQFGVLTQKGRATRFLSPGRHVVWFPDAATNVQKIDADRGYTIARPEVEALLPSGIAEVLEVGRSEVALISIDGIPSAVLRPGRYFLWKTRANVTADLVSTSTVRANLSPPFRVLAQAARVTTSVAVQSYQSALVYVDGEHVDTVAAGIHSFFTVDTQVRFHLVDLRLAEFSVASQEVMTADKVTLRVNLQGRYRVVDPVASVHQATSREDTIYVAVQLAARRYIAGHTVDQLLEGRDEVSRVMRAELAPLAKELGLEIADVDVKDIILPGEMKTILNQVIEAQKRAEAHAIARREETAATRSLANTARVLENNPMLMKLKELEALKEIAETVGEVKLVAGQDLLAKLSLSS